MTNQRKGRMNMNSIKCMRIFDNYLLYSDGRVYSEKRNRFLTGTLDSYGYRQVKLNSKLHLLHRLVAKHFLPNPDLLPEVDHLDYNRDNNDVSNLRWVSRKANLEHSKIRRCSAQAKSYVFLSPEGVSTSVFGLSGFCKDNGLDQAAMHRVSTGKSKSHKGWRRYESD
ncbi:putative HNH endonuclease [Klebsiella phage vB_KpnP_ZK1]|nr:putative HNH endonuclease [Klebsiella phage vB_KpnP_ZK1]